MKCSLSQSPFQYYGGKFEMAEWLTSLLPRGQTLVMPFGGAGSPLWHVEPYPVEVYNDLDGDIVNFFRVCRDHPQSLSEKLELTPYARAEYESCRAMRSDDPIERARMYATVARMSHGGDWGRSWSFAVGHSRRGMSSSVSRFLHLPETVLEIASRLKTVQIECMDAIKLIQKYDRPDTVFYLDPPYYPDTRSGSDVYRHEMSPDQHVELLAAIKLCKGKVAISGYTCPVYDEALSGWDRTQREVPCRSNVTTDGPASRPKRVEVLWRNFSTNAKGTLW